MVTPFSYALLSNRRLYTAYWNFFYATIGHWRCFADVGKMFGTLVTAGFTGYLCPLDGFGKNVKNLDL
ncbi:MAG: hypothetical protein IJ709_07975 [Selenomonas sp.]|nr:hypothetical protein [Selenomonas sp.]